ncbi:MAG: DNA polymerase III subunit alpha, partial [Planctomycetes bacterium]|nr:DNA polymerase III subunit alpha [Planctomycetota bacterium]
MPFVHLSVRSHYSLLRGTARVEELCRAARARGMSALALTDRNALYGFYPFLCAAVRAGVRPLVGAELAIGVERVVALVKERFGYATLCRAITAVQAHLPRPERATARAHGPERDPASQRDRVRDAVAATPRGSAAAFVGAEPDAPPDGPECAPGEYWMRGGGRERSRGRGPALDLPMPVAAGPFSLAAHLARDRAGLVLLTDDLPLLETIARQSGIEDLYREVRASLCGPDASRAGGDRRAVPDSVLLAALPVVATNDVYFLDPADHALHRLLRAIALNTSLSRVPALEVVHPGAWLCPPADMERRFRDLPEAFENAGRIADGCRVDWLAETGIRPAAPAPTPSHPPAAPSIVHGKTPTLRLPVAARPLPPPGSNRQSVASHHPPSPVVSHPHALPPRPASPFGINLQSSISNLQSVGLPPSSPPVSPPPPRSSALPVSPPAPAPLLGRPIFPVFAAPGGGDPFDYLRAETWTGARRRYREITPAVRARIEYELALIREKGFASYFLVVRDIVRRSERTCGRGSAAASIVAYVLGITHVDPIAHNLYFERFLNPGRVDPPDIDVDFPWDERDAVLEYLFRTYGPAHTAMIANHVTFQPRAAIREVAKVYGLPEGEIADLTERIPWFYDAPGLRDMLRDHPHFRDVALRPPWPEILALAERLVGFPRLLSVHCGGVVITPDPITNHAPLEPAAKGLPIVQWEKDAAEELGLVKIDLLGNRSLAVIRDALAAVRAHHGVDVRYDEWDPLEDPATQALLAAGRTMGVFYVESPAMRRLQQKTGRGDFGHLVIASSIIRPAANAFIREYVRRLRGEPYASLHPILDTVLAETYGIMSYQEDVSKIAMAMGGFTAAEADGLRKLLSKKDRVHKLAEYRRRFADGARIRGIAADVIDKVWEMIESFAGYSFCKPHSASYALVSFKSAWLKAHFPAEFMAAVISNQGGYYSTFAYLSEARRMGIALLGPDVNASGRAYIGWTPAPGVTAVAPTPAGGAPLPPPSSGGAVPPFAHFVPDVPPPPPDLSPAANSAQGEWGRSLPHEAPRGARSGVGAGEGACYDRSGYHADPS